jgi:hypothetical protein
MTSAGAVVDAEQFEATFAAIALVSTLLATENLAPPTDVTPKDVVEIFLSRNVPSESDIELAMAKFCGGMVSVVLALLAVRQKEVGSTPNETLHLILQISKPLGE